MIWCGGRVVPDDALAVSVLDRTFEHGLGLFETLRTWEGRAVLLDRHLARLAHSATELGISLTDVALPDARAVAELLRASSLEDDVLLRITLSGGRSSGGGATLWMRPAPLPPANRKAGALVDLGSWRIVRGDPLARHKTLNYWARRSAHESAARAGYDEVLSMTLGTCVWEGSRTNVFLVQGDALLTPSRDGPLVPGIMRRLVLELAGELPMGVYEVGELKIDQFDRADEVFLTNSVRGIIPVRGLHQTDWTDLGIPALPRVGFLKQSTWPAPGPWTERLALQVSDWLRSGGTPA